MAKLEARALFEEGRLREAASALGRGQTNIADRILACRIDAELGRTTAARTAAESLASESLSSGDRAALSLVVALDQFRHWDLSAGLRSMNAATAAAREHSLELEAEVLGRLVVAIADWISSEAALNWLSDLRRLALKSASRRALLSLHYVRAMILMRAGQHAASAREISTARLHAEQIANAMWTAKLALVESALFAYQGLYEEAQRCAADAVRSTSGNGAAAIAGNLAQFALLRGDYAGSRRALTQAFREALPGGNTIVALQDTQMQLAIAEGDLAEARELRQDARGSVDRTGTEQVAWHQLTLARLHLRSLEYTAAAEVALTALPRVERMADGNLLPRMRLLAAESLALCGRRPEAVNMMGAAALTDLSPSLEILGELARVAGRLTSPIPPEALWHFDRAKRLFVSLGNVPAASEVDANVRDTVTHQGETSSYPWIDSALATSEPTAPVRVVRRSHATPADSGGATAAQSMAALVDHLAYAGIAGYELLTLLANCASTPAAAFLARTDRGESLLAWLGETLEHATALTSDSAIEIPLGAQHGREFRVLAQPPESPADAITLLAIQRVVANARDMHRARLQERERASLWPEPSAEQQLGLIVASEGMGAVVRLIRRVAPSPITVLITGETGTGKELLARGLHEASQRKDKPFVPFNCSAVAKDMLDAQLFGYRRGAFTGAQDAFPGVIRAAAGGTLFLDEIGEISLEVQPKLLRFLESGEIHPLGEARPIHVDVRVVAATNANLEHLVAERRFREDLYYRLNVMRVPVPPLRERREEVPALVNYFLDRFGEEYHKPGVRVADETLEYLTLYSWPGNVRELTNEIRRMMALTEAGAVLMPEHLSPKLAASRRTRPAAERELTPDEVVVRTDQPVSAATEHLERTMIQRAMDLCGGRVDDAARLLGLSRKGLYLKRQRYQME